MVDSLLFVFSFSSLNTTTLLCIIQQTERENRLVCLPIAVRNTQVSDHCFDNRKEPFSGKNRGVAQGVCRGIEALLVVCGKVGLKRFTVSSLATSSSPSLESTLVVPGQGPQSHNWNTSSSLIHYRTIKISPNRPFTNMTFHITKEIVLQDPDCFGLDMIKTIHELIEMDEYGSPTPETVDVVCQLLQLERPFVEEVYWVLLGKSPSFGLSMTVNDMILKDYLYNLEVKHCAAIDNNNRGNDVELAVQMGVSVALIRCIRQAILSAEDSDCLSPQMMQVIKVYDAQKECTAFGDSFSANAEKKEELPQLVITAPTQKEKDVVMPSSSNGKSLVLGILCFAALRTCHSYYPSPKVVEEPLTVVERRLPDCQQEWLPFLFAPCTAKKTHD